MTSTASSVDQYIEQLPMERKVPVERLRGVILKNIPKGFEETISYGMIGYVVPHNLYPAGYHCTPELPLPFMNIASQKNYISLYHMGLYADDKLLMWFKDEYSKIFKSDADMGKSCIRFKKPFNIPYELIGTLSTKMTVIDWIKLYEKKFKKN
ncbi:MAG: DUF1801 domain-containing protein [Ginsengibacter sp.]